MFNKARRWDCRQVTSHVRTQMIDDLRLISIPLKKSDRALLLCLYASMELADCLCLIHEG